MIDGKKNAADDFLFDGNIEGNCLLPSVIARAAYLQLLGRVYVCKHMLPNKNCLTSYADERWKA